MPPMPPPSPPSMPPPPSSPSIIDVAEVWVFEYALLVLPPCFLLCLCRAFAQRNTLLGPREGQEPLL
jgi:hypothetical protein